MDTSILTPQQLTAFRAQLKDFRDHITYSEAWIIHKYFNDSVDEFFDSPQKFEEFKLMSPAEKNSCYQTVYRNLRLFNLATKNLDHNILRSLINKCPGEQKRFPWSLVSAAIKPYCIQQHGKLTWKTHAPTGLVDAAQDYNNHYSIGRDAMKEIFADRELLAHVLSFQSDYYSPRCRKFIKRSIELNKKKKLDTELDAVLDDMLGEDDKVRS